MRACGARRTNLYPAGHNPSQGPSCALRGRGLQRGMGPFSTAASFSHVEIRSHIHLGFISSFYPVFDLRSSPLRRRLVRRVGGSAPSAWRGLATGPRPPRGPRSTSIRRPRQRLAPASISSASACARCAAAPYALPLRHWPSAVSLVGPGFSPVLNATRIAFKIDETAATCSCLDCFVMTRCAP